jgi:hypothetical protein
MSENMSTIEIDLTDEEFCKVAKLAHERDITFNKMVAIIIQEEIDRRNALHD